MNKYLALANFLKKRGFQVGYYHLSGFGLSYFIIAPDGEYIVPVGDGLEKKPASAVDHWREGWLLPGDPTDDNAVNEIMHQAYDRFTGYLKLEG